MTLQADDAKGRELKLLMARHGVRRRPLACNSRGQLLVAEGSSVHVVHAGSMMADCDEPATSGGTVAKTSLISLARLVVPFRVASVVINPLNDLIVAAVGIQQIRVLTMAVDGHLASALPIELSLEAVGGGMSAVLATEWLPGSQTRIAVATEKSVKLFDLAVDNISPTHFFVVPECSGTIADFAVPKCSGTIADAALVALGGGNRGSGQVEGQVESGSESAAAAAAAE